VIQTNFSNLGNSLTAAVVSEGVQSLVYGDDFDFAAVASQSLGYAIGNSLFSPVDAKEQMLEHIELQNGLGRAEAERIYQQSYANRVVSGTVNLDGELEKLGMLKANAQEIAASYKDKTQRAEMASKLGGEDKLKQFISAYKDDLKSQDVYLKYDPSDKSISKEASTIRDALGAFGIERVSQSDLKAQGFSQKDFDKEDSSGFYAALYHDKAEGSYTLAFRGTELTDLGDLGTDYANARGYVTEQYEQAADLANKVNTSSKFNVDLSFTGHSLGGGLAIMAAAATGLSANTFNSASVNEKVVHNLKGSLEGIDKRVNAYYLEKDPISGLQDYFDFVPDAQGNRIEMSARSNVGGFMNLGHHSNTNIIDSLYDQLKYGGKVK
jgi:hypothetical protein